MIGYEIINGRIPDGLYVLAAKGCGLSL